MRALNSVEINENKSTDQLANSGVPLEGKQTQTQKAHKQN